MIQEQVINKILQTGDASIIVNNNLTDDYFSDCLDEFRFIKDHMNRYNKVPDMATFLGQFPNFDVLDVKENNVYLLDVLTKDKNKRFLAETFNKMRTVLMSDDVDKGLSLLKQAYEGASISTNIECVDILKDKRRYDAYLDRVQNQDKYFISTGLKELDDAIGGWDVKEELATIVARPGCGKSWLVLKFAAAAAEQGRRVGIYSGEMTEEKVGYRLDTWIGHIPNGALVHGGASVKEQYTNFMDRLDQIEGSIKVITPKMMGGAATVSALRAFVEKEQIEILFVDQLSLLEDERKAKASNEKVANISKDLKLLQSTKLIPIINVSQQNREKSEDGSYGTEQVALSDRVSQDSSCIIFIEKKDDLIKLHVAKSRYSVVPKPLTYKVNLNEGIMQYVPDEDSDQSQVQASGYSEEDVF